MGVHSIFADSSAKPQHLAACLMGRMRCNGAMFPVPLATLPRGAPRSRSRRPDRGARRADRGRAREGANRARRTAADGSDARRDLRTLGARRSARVSLEARERPRRVARVARRAGHARRAALERRVPSWFFASGQVKLVRRSALIWSRPRSTSRESAGRPSFKRCMLAMCLLDRSR